MLSFEKKKQKEKFHLNYVLALLPSRKIDRINKNAELKIVTE